MWYIGDSIVSSRKQPFLVDIDLFFDNLAIFFVQKPVTKNPGATYVDNYHLVTFNNGYTIFTYIWIAICKAYWI